MRQFVSYRRRRILRAFASGCLIEDIAAFEFTGADVDWCNANGLTSADVAGEIENCIRDEYNRLTKARKR